MSDNQLAGRTAVVTGAASGIGLATARRLAAAGARVFGGDIEPTPTEGPETGRGEIRHAHCDVRDLDQLRALIDGAADETGRLDILVNNAGIVMVGQPEEIDELQWDACLDTNLKAAFFGVKYALPHLRGSGGGSIVNTASNAGLLPRAHDPVYSISKMALVGLTRSLALCLSGERIRVNCVCPGPVQQTGIMDSDLGRQPDPGTAAATYIAASPLARAWGRMITPDEVAESVLYLVSDAAAMVTGTAIAVDGGKSLGVPPKTAGTDAN